MENQYLDLCKRIIRDGEWVHNDRTQKRCLTVINADFVYDVSKSQFPLCTTRKSFWKSAIAEIIGYLRGYDNAAEFRKLGTKTWDMNANQNQTWLNNPHRKGQDDMGLVYGAIGRHFPSPQGDGLDLLKKIYHNLRSGVDDRAEIYTFYHPGAFELGCLRPCMYSHHFSLVGDDLYLNSTQRSCDVPLGLNFNMVQVYVLLALMAQITGKNPQQAFHKIVNCHIYEDQLDLMKQQVQRQPFPPPTIHINPDIQSLEDIETWVTLSDFEVTDYQHHPAIAYPFSV
jgi:thymidylate synthase